MNSVWPSGAELTMYSAASWLLAPGLFSTTACWPNALLKRCARARPMMSVTPPAGAGDTMVMVLVGKVCADAGTAAPSRPSTSHATFLFFMPASSRAKLPTFRHDALDTETIRDLGFVSPKPIVRHALA